MYDFLFLVILAAFAGMVFFNLFFRIKILRLYRYLRNNHVSFHSRHFFNEELMENEVLNRHPKHRTEILRFVKLIRQSITLASILIVIIIAFGYLLFRFR